MRSFARVVPGVIALTLGAGATAFAQADAAADEAKIAEALSAGLPAMVETATVADWDGRTLKEGTGRWTCFPTPPGQKGPSPMCLDGPWMAWGQAWQGHTDPGLETIGIAYMLAGDGGASNSDPYAESADDADDWVSGGPHLMIIAPDPAMLDGIPTDPDNGGPWVMWAGTPYAHVMVPAYDESGDTR